MQHQLLHPFRGKFVIDRLRLLSCAPQDLTNSLCTIPDRLALLVAALRGSFHLCCQLGKHRELTCRCGNFCGFRRGYGDSCDAGVSGHCEEVLKRCLD